MRLKVLFNLTGLTRYDDEASVFVSFCPALGIYSQDETQEGAKKALVDAVFLFFGICYERGIIDQALKDRGFVDADKSNTTPSQYAQELVAYTEEKDYRDTFDFEVPLHLVAAAAQQTQCLH